MRVSIITITYNSEAHLEETIKSVLGQDCPDIEYIIVDGGSTDGTLDIVRKYSDRIARWVSEPDEGISDAMNKGIGMASGEVIGIIHSDDYFEPGAVRAVAEAFREHPETDVLYGDLRYHKEDGAVICKPARNTERAFSQGLPISHPTVFVSKRAYEKYGLYDVSCKYAMDNELFTRFLHAGARFHYLKRVIANMRTGGVSTVHIYHGYREVRDVAIKYGSSKFRSYAYFYFRIIFKEAERKAGLLLRKLGLHGIVKLYRKVFYPHVSGDH